MGEGASAPVVCCCCSCITLLPLLITLIVLSVRVGHLHSADGSSSDCNRYSDNCYDCLASPCGFKHIGPTYSNSSCKGICNWNVNYIGQGVCQSYEYPYDTRICQASTTSSSIGFIIFFSVLSGLSLCILSCFLACTKRSSDAERDYERKWESAGRSTCGSCGHKKHHGSNCYTQVSNSQSLCTCGHKHHKGGQCGQTIHYTEYKSEQKKVNVKKTRTLYRQQMENVPVVKSRVKYVDQGGWVQRPYGPGNGTHAVYESRMVAQTETYTETESRMNNVAYYEDYWEDEWQTVQIPIAKTRTCTCTGEGCRCSTCVSTVNCGCSKCDCQICTARENKKDEVERKSWKWGAILVAFAFIGVVWTVFALCTGMNSSFGIGTANAFKRQGWIYNLKSVGMFSLAVGWSAWGFVFVCSIICLLILACGDELFPTRSPDKKRKEEENTRLWSQPSQSYTDDIDIQLTLEDEGQNNNDTIRF